MKSVSLKNVQQFLIQLTKNDYESYKINENEFKQMWTTQTSEFWVKFVVSIRKHIKNTSRKYDEQCEKELITYLKSLTHKNYVEINNYIKNSNDLIVEYDKLIQNLKDEYENLNEVERNEQFSQLRLIILKLKCSGSFIHILSAYQHAEDGSDFSYSPPEAWFKSVVTVEPFESFLRSKWGGFKNVEEILGCKKDDIKWWKSPAKKIEHKTEMVEVTENLVVERIVNFSPPEDYQLHGLEIADKNPEDNQELSWQTRIWLPSQSTHWRIFEEDESKISQNDLIWKKNPLFKLWPLMEYSFPPVLHEKFHQMNVSNLMDGDPVKYNLAISTWFIQYTESFGNRYMNYIQQSRDNLANRTAVPLVDARKNLIEEWKHRRDLDKEILESILSKPGAPNIMQHSAIDPEDFLIEPCVLIQLPWQPVLFRQWLAVALIEIMKFEVECVELRHWPLSKDIEPIARELLTLVGDTKERILLGWSILSFEATTYPNADKKHPSFILDQVVIPSINTLAFLCSGNANIILQSIKNLSWMQNESLESKVNLPRNAYCINEILNGFAVLFFGHYTFWKQYNSIRDPFPTVQLTQELGLETQLNQIQKDKPPVLPPENIPFYINRLNIDEERIFTVLQNTSQKVPTEYSTNKNLAKTITVIKEAVIKCGHFSKEKLDTLLPMLQTDEAHKAATDIFEDIEEIKTPLQQIILSSVIYHDINRYIGTTFGQTSIMSWLIRLGAQVTEKEQLVRVIAACSVILQESPKICGSEFGKCPVESVLNEKTLMTKEQMIEQIKDVRENEKLESRDTLFATFHEDWQEEVDSDLAMPTVSEGYDAIVKRLEVRIGRIVWNVGKRNFIEHAKGGESYPDSLIVQYLLPCYISLLLDVDKYPNTDKNNLRKINLYHFVLGIVKYYENTYRCWIRDSKPRYPMPSHPIPSLNPDEMKRKRTLASFYLESASHILHGYTGLGRLGFGTDPLTGLHIISLNILDYPMFEGTNELKSKIEIYNCETWLKDIYPHTQLLHHVSFSALKLPSPEALLNCPDLHELYLASLIVHQLEVLSSIYQSMYPDVLAADSDIYHQLIEYAEALRIWRYALYCILFETEKKCKYPMEMIENFIRGEGKVLLLKVFSIIKLIREQLRSLNKKVQKIEVCSFNTNFFKKYNNMYFTNNLNSLKLFKDDEITKEFTLKRKLGHGIECSCCHIKETISKEFHACKVCILQGIRNVRFFCSKNCRLKYWQDQHMEEHLVFDVGICDILPM